MAEAFFQIAVVRSADELRAVSVLFEAYAASLDVDLAYQGFNEELAGLPGQYAPPAGALLLARDEAGAAVGCVGLRPLPQVGCCEMKRLFVSPPGRGLGLGRALAEAVIVEAARLGYREMWLDTLPTMASAIGLYETLGFARIAPYYGTAPEGTIFLGRSLEPRSDSTLAAGAGMLSARAMSDDGRPMRTFGRIKGRTLRAGRAQLMQDRLPELTLDLTSGPIDAGALMPGARELWVEIGFGGGEHLAGQAARHPDVLILGAEPFVDGQAKLVSQVEREELANVRIHPGDARELLAALPNAAADRTFILFPDPWPKTRHHKRRLIQREVVIELARVLKPGGRLRFATDWKDYADWALERINASGLFDWPAERADDWRMPPADHLTTRYESKRLGDCAPVFLDFVRR